MTNTDLLSRIPLFRSLTEEALNHLAMVSREVSFEAGTEIVEVGEVGHCLYVILEGTVQVLYPARSEDFELARLGPGEFFGEMAVLNNEPRSATVQATEPVRALALEKEDLHQILLTSPQMALKLLETLSTRIRNADEQMSGLSEKAMRDGLTGLLNRRAFHERIREEADRARRYGDAFALILLDVDHFKAVNDSLGHDVGDRVLAWLGRIFQEQTRAADKAFRIGGEEFAVLAPATSTPVARTVAQRLVDTVGEASPPVDSPVSISLSAGVASCPDHGHAPEHLFRLADQALLRAKKEGRNRVCAPVDAPRPETGEPALDD